MGDGVTAQDATGRLIYANSAAAKSLGFSSGAELLAAPIETVLSRFSLSDEFGDALPFDHLPGRRALAEKTETSALVRFRVSGSAAEHWSLVKASPVLDESGELRFVVNVWQDVSEQKRSELAQRFLAEAGEQLVSSLDFEATLSNIARLAVPELADWCAVHLVQPHGEISQLTVQHRDEAKIEWVRAIQARYPPDPQSPTGVHAVIRSGESQRIYEISDAMLRRAARDAEHYSMLQRVGLSSAMIVPMKARDHVLGAITLAMAESGRTFGEADLALAEELAHRSALAVDNARLYNAERAARHLAEEIQAQFQSLFDGVPDAILVVDSRLQLVDSNPAASALFGYTPNELRSIDLPSLAPRPDSEWSKFTSSALGKEWRGEAEVVRKDGTYVPVDIWSQCVILPSGPIGIAVVRDISERRALDDARADVLAAVSHDLRNPLGVIKAHAQALRRTISRGQLPEIKRIDTSLAAMDTMASRMSSMLEDIVDVVQAHTRSEDSLDRQMVDLVALARRCSAQLEATSDRRLHVDAAPESIAGFWDERSVERIVINVVNNAIKYSDTESQITVSVRLDDDVGWVVLSVADNGIGIPTSDLGTIFEPYRRGSNVGGVGGTGLGLSSARRISEQHGGTIDIKSSEGQGTTVTIRLPRGKATGQT